MEAAAALSVLNSVKTSTEDQNSSQNSNPALDVVDESAKRPEKASPVETLLISVDPGIEVRISHVVENSCGS